MRYTMSVGLSFVCILFLTVIATGPWVIGAELAEQEAKEGFVTIFDGKTLGGWQGDTKGYEPKDGILVCTKAGGRLHTEKQYGNFVFRFEFKLQPGGNNGVNIRGMEIQILDDDAKKHAKLKPCQYHGSIYCRVPAKRGHQKPLGEWNKEEISVNGKHVKVTLNGVVIVDAETDHPALKKPKGPLTFMGHHEHVEFRNLRIRELGDATAEEEPAKDASVSMHPNIVLILADDMGPGEPSHAGGIIPTPTLDRMAKEGMRFTDAHTSSSVCTPTRYGILTGRYNWRSRLKSSVLFNPTDCALMGSPTSEPVKLSAKGGLPHRVHRQVAPGRRLGEAFQEREPRQGQAICLLAG